ncbi:hypothetical protein [Humibacillus sp. DSM 29435]|uniref:hypothetical protein n=1 Tax=Humibacillus sp. DSM 29435 TaxID=1869167 RepID=UPI0011130F08|nr:hypothetical protein [Humibacillus sp. DSM 29435]
MSDEVAAPDLARHVESPEVPDLYLVVRYAIDARIDALQSVSLNTTSSCCTTGTGSIEQLLKSLRADRALLGEHGAAAAAELSGPDEPVVSKACGLPQPCPHVLDLARTYGVKTPRKARGRRWR